MAVYGSLSPNVQPEPPFTIVENAKGSQRISGVCNFEVYNKNYDDIFASKAQVEKDLRVFGSSWRFYWLKNQLSEVLSVYRAFGITLELIIGLKYSNFVRDSSKIVKLDCKPTGLSLNVKQVTAKDQRDIPTHTKLCNRVWNVAQPSWKIRPKELLRQILFPSSTEWGCATSLYPEYQT